MGRAGVLRPGHRSRDGEQEWAVRGVSLETAAGEVLVLVGPNAAGKSSVLRLLAGLWRAHEGQVSIDGRSAYTAPRTWVAARVAYLAQAVPTLADFTVEELVCLGRYPIEGRWPGAQRDRAWLEPLLERVDVGHLRERRVTQLSGGELQRVLLARCLASGARTLLLDEPTASLDLAHALAVLEICRDLAADGATVVLALHDLGMALRYADRVAMLKEGRLLALGAARQVLEPALLRSTFGVEAELLHGVRGDTFLFHGA
jgi:iron complex transport system ATP-binding protein